MGGGLSLRHVVSLASFPHKHTPSFAEGTPTHTHTYPLTVSHTHSQLLILLSLLSAEEQSPQEFGGTCCLLANIIYVDNLRGGLNDFLIGAWLLLSGVHIPLFIPLVSPWLFWDTVLEFKRRQRAAEKNRDMCFAPAASYYCPFSPIH